MKVWITKYALTKGIFEKEVEDCGDGMVKDSSCCLLPLTFWYLL